jgi:hypothetical protein
MTQKERRKPPYFERSTPPSDMEKLMSVDWEATISKILSTLKEVLGEDRVPLKDTPNPPKRENTSSGKK